MDYNDGRFCDNGRSGYILKPDYMRQGTTIVYVGRPLPYGWVRGRQTSWLSLCLLYFLHCM